MNIQLATALALAFSKSGNKFLMWGGQVIVCSTHDGYENHFNEQIQDILVGKQDYKHLRIDFDDALHAGLYERICLVTGKEWSPEAEAAWRQQIIKFYGSGADEELFCIPSQSSGAYLSRAMITACMNENIELIRWKPVDGFVDFPLEVRTAEMIAIEEIDQAPAVAAGVLTAELCVWHTNEFSTPMHEAPPSRWFYNLF